MANQVTVELYARYYKDFFEVGSKILIEKFELGIIEFEIEKLRDFWGCINRAGVTRGSVTRNGETLQ